MLSVVCPTYNRAALLSDCVLPFMDLPSHRVEVLIVDDCSDDLTCSLCSRLADIYGPGRIRYFRQPSNKGPQFARNLGITHARGEYFMFIDSDDIPVIDGVLALVTVLDANPNLDYVYGNVLITDLDLIPASELPSVGSEFTGSFAEIAGYNWHTMGALYRRQCIERVGFWDIRLSGSQDWEYQARVKIAGGIGQYVNSLIGYWRQHSGDRVGTQSFRRDYLISASIACESILANAMASSKCDQTLELRLAKKLFIHALEWGEQGHINQRNAFLRQAMDCFHLLTIYKALLRTYMLMPCIIDSYIRKFIFGIRQAQHS